MTDVANITELRNNSVPPSTPTPDAVHFALYVQGYFEPGDGGGGVFIWRTEEPYASYTENYGTIIKSDISTEGSWIRQYDGYINVNFFGALGLDDLPGLTYSQRIQYAIDYASQNAVSSPLLKGSTVFIPNGSYKLESKITLKSGVTVLGESINNTLIYATEGTGYLFEIEEGPVFLNISNLKIIGRDSDKGCFLFKAQPPLNPLEEPRHGGLWSSTVKNISISGFNGHGIYLEGGSGESIENEVAFTINQFNVFENVRVTKNNNVDFSKVSHALYMSGQLGQHTFVNCEFDGYSYFIKVEDTWLGYYDKTPNIRIENSELNPPTSNVVTFLNCTIQHSDYGVSINYAENITFDNCWFEGLGVAVMVNGDRLPSKSINILNSRFANASGFGSLLAPANIKKGQCVAVNDGVVNIYNNYVTVSNIEASEDDSCFVLGFPGNNGINCYNNTFAGDTLESKKLSKTYGIAQGVNIIDQAIDCKSNKLIFINLPPAPDPLPDPIPPPAPTLIKNIISATNAGEVLVIRANGLDVTFDNTGNIFLTNRSTFELLNGEIASFVKIDIGTDNETYQLLSFTHTTP